MADSLDELYVRVTGIREQIQSIVNDKAVKAGVFDGNTAAHATFTEELECADISLSDAQAVLATLDL